MQCQHPECTCRARENDRYCSDYCRQAGSTTSADASRQVGCRCGHAQCGH